MQGKLKLQTAVDLLSAYGIAIITMLVVVSVIFVIGFNVPPTPQCLAPPGFTCSYVSINTSSTLIIKFSQALGTSIKINGIACATQQNFTDNYPLYGNVAVNAITSYYPVPLFPPGNVVTSGSSYIAYMYCYNNVGKATGLLGKPFTGFVWINYSIPNYNYQVQQIASFTAFYSNSSLVLK